MVNTFLVCEDYSESARHLDYRRLGKQRVEAQQILNGLQDIDFMANYVNIPLLDKNVDHDKEARVEFVTSVLSEIKQLNIKCFLQTDTNIQAYEYKVVAQEGERVFSTGWKKHPALIAWISFESSLKEYITCHIEEWISRGYKNTMKTYPTTNAKRPSWTYDSEIHTNHRAALLLKEVVRNEKPWYRLDKFFTEGVLFRDYIWP